MRIYGNGIRAFLLFQYLNSRKISAIYRDNFGRIKNIFLAYQTCGVFYNGSMNEVAERAMYVGRKVLI